MPPKKKGGKKDDDWDAVESAAQKKLAALNVVEDKVEFSDDDSPVPVPSKKKVAPTKRAAMSALLMMGDDDDDDDKPLQQAESDTEESAPVPSAAKDKRTKTKAKGKKNKTTAEDEDIDAILQNLDKPLEKEPKKEQGDEVEGADEKKKKKKKKQKADSAEPEGTPQPEGTPAPEEEGEEKAEGAKKKKKKKGKKDEGNEKEEDKEMEKEKPGKKKKQVTMIREFLRMQEEAKARAEQELREEEERLAAAAKKKEEEEKKLKEAKELEKQRKKEREEALRKAGKYLTPAQKKKQAQQLQKLAQMGIDVNKVKEEGGLRKADTKAAPVKEEKLQKTEPEKPKEEPKLEPSKVEPDVEKAPEEQEEILDDWELADNEEEEQKFVEESAKASVVAPKVEAEEESDESEEESDEDEESEEETSDEDEEDESDEEETSKETKEQRIERIRLRLKHRHDKAVSEKSLDVLRAPVICVLGHVDTGKTKMLDTIRRTNVQDCEAGGITQQIGATQVPRDAIIQRCKAVQNFEPEKIRIPGFLIIDTPGHESFANLRSRGSSLCDYAILVVDLMHGLEPQTIESLKLLLKRKTPFVVALNKIDRLHQYESSPYKDVYVHLKSQAGNVQLEFKKRYEETVVQFAEQGINVCLSYEKNKLKTGEYVPMVPTSAFCGDGVGNLMAFIADTAQTNHADRLAYVDDLDATVMEVKAIPGLGTTIDVILVNGTLKIGDIIILAGTEKPIMTSIRDLKMPEPLRELRVKSEYRSFKEIRAAQGIKILAKGLENALAGLPLYVSHNADEVEVLMADCETALSSALNTIKKKPQGVCVQASTLGSLEALLEFLKTQKIPYANVNIGPVHKRDVQKAVVMKEHKEEFGCILAFDVKIERDAQLFADREGVRIFSADIIYHLEDDFLKFREELHQKYRQQNEHIAIFPCKLRIMPQHIFNARNPIVIGVSVEAGQLKRGTPIIVPSKDNCFLGSISSIQRNHEEVALAKTGDEVCIKIENTTGDAPKLYGRHFTHEDFLVSRISRESIDACKQYFRDDLSKADWQLVIELKKMLDIL